MRDEFSGYRADLYQNNHTQAEKQRFSEQFGAITNGMADLMREGKCTDDEAVQDLVRQHYDFCCQFWTPTNAAYKSLALSYLLPSPYRDSYEAVEAGLAKFTHDAVVIWADANLAD